MPTGSKIVRLEKGVKRNVEFEIIIDGDPVMTYSGETLVTALQGIFPFALDWHT